MLFIDLKTILANVGMGFNKTPPQSLLGPMPEDYVCSVLCDLGYSPLNGNYTIVPSLIKTSIEAMLINRLTGVPTTTKIELITVHHYVGIKVGD